LHTFQINALIQSLQFLKPSTRFEPYTNARKQTKIDFFFLNFECNMLPHHRIVHNDVLLQTLINVTLARLNCKLPDDGRRPKHVGAILICFNVNFSGL
jgi:hypothetical protein